jgi:hypothetical protein
MDRLDRARGKKSFESHPGIHAQDPDIQNPGQGDFSQSFLDPLGVLFQPDEIFLRRGLSQPQEIFPGAKADLHLKRTVRAETPGPIRRAGQIKMIQKTGFHFNDPNLD